ncbi:carboxymuconolactone decarboxylase family protein [Streptomyces sp. NPDC056144]|uniref:carboxymuconolactone decarboxylase family protein n=1 Tax=unclassified Streptomyces TaxID=2593676 RepID=UPI0035D79DA3
MRSRLRDPVDVLPAAGRPARELLDAVRSGGVDGRTLELVRLRVSQINGSAAGVEAAAGAARAAGVGDAPLTAVAAWRDSPHFTPAQRAALGLAEAATRLADRPDAVNDRVWDRAATHYDEQGLAALILLIGVTNLFDRLDTTTRRIAGAADIRH